MAVTENSYTGNGSTTNYSFTFPYLKSTDVQVQVDATVTTAWTFHNATTVKFNTAPANGAKIKILRKTNVDSLTATFYPGSAIKSEDLNDNYTQNLYSTQETSNRAFENTGGTITGNVTFGEDVTLTWEGATDNAHETTLTVEDPTADRTITFPNRSGTVITSGDTATVTATILADDAVDTAAIQDNAVTMAKLNSGALPTDITVASANIVNGTIVDADVGAGAAIAHSKLSGISGGNVLLGNSSNVPTSTTLSGDVTVNSSGVTAITAGSIVTADLANSAVTTAKINNDAITADKIGDDVVNSEHYAAGSIDTEHIADSQVTTAKIAADAVTGAKIADNTIDSEHYVDGSIDTAHIADLNVTTAKIAADAITGAKIADDQINSEHYVADSIDTEHYAPGSVDTTAIADDAVTNAKIVDSAVTTAKILNDAVTADKIADAVIVTNSEQASASVNDTTFFTTSASDARYFNISSGDTIKDGQTFPDNDTTIATTAAINDRIIDLVDDVGGFVPIANETSFPAANPDVNNGAGTLISIKALASNLVSNGSGVATIANGAGSGNTVTINGLANSTTYAAGFGMIVETTSTLHTYTFHRQVPIATEVSTVAGSISNVNTVASNISNVNTVASNNSNVTAVAGNNSNITAVAGNASNINSAVSNASNINSAVSNASNINSAVSNASNINTVAGSISNVNSVASNMGTVNDFAARYRTGSSNPTDSLDTGDLFFNTSANELKVYNGSSWQGGVTATGSFAVVTGNTFTGENKYNDNVKAKWGTGSDLQILHNGTSSLIDNNTGHLYLRNNVDDDDGSNIYIEAKAGEQSAVFNDDGAVELYYDNTKRFETNSGGAKIIGTFRVDDGSTTDNRLCVGTGGDLLIYHTGADSFINNYTGQLYVRNVNNIYIQPASGENGVVANANGAVELYYDNSKKLETTSTGISTTGNCVITGHFYGPDNSELRLGSTDDLKLYHDGNNSYIDDTGTGSLILKSSRVSFNDTSNNEWGRFDSDGVRVVDSKKFRAGTGDDLQIYHDGTDSFIQNGTGNLAIKAKTDEHGIIIKPDADVEIYYNGSKKFETAAGGVRIFDNLLLDGDSRYIKLGASDDLQIVHDGTNSLITNSTGDLKIYSDNFIVNNAANSENKLRALNNGAVELYYDNVKRFETTSAGISIVGTIEASGNLDVPDWGQLKLGTGDDLLIYHNGSHSYIDNTSGTGNLYIQDQIVRVRSATSFAVDNADGSETALMAALNGAVSLYYDNSQKLVTTSGGAQITGYLSFPDNSGIKCGDSADLHIYHDGSNSYISELGTGDLIVNTNGNNIFLKPTGNETGVKVIANGAVELYHNGSQKFETTSTGVKVTGSLDLSASTYAITWPEDPGTNASRKWDFRADQGAYGQFGLKYGAASGDTPNETAIEANTNGNVELYYDNTKKLETTSGGAKVTGKLELTDSLYWDGDTDTTIDNAGGTGNFMRFKTGGTTVMDINASQNVVIHDNRQLIIGGGSDLKLYHSSSNNNSYITSPQNNVIHEYAVGNSWTLQTTSGDDRIVCPGNSTSLGVYLYHNGSKKFETHSGGINVTGSVNPTGNVTLLDDSKLKLGTGDDLQLYHDGSHSYIKDVGTGNFYITGSYLAFMNAAGNEYMLDGTENGAASLFYDGSQKFHTRSDGVRVLGDATWSDNGKARFGPDGDLQVYHDGTFNVINASNGNLEIRHGTEKMIACANDGQAELYYDGAKKLYTDPNGVRMDDSVWSYWGSGQDMYLGHNGSHAYFKNTTGQLKVLANEFRINNQADNEQIISTSADGAVELYYNGLKKLDTTTDGIRISAGEGQQAAITMEADEADDHADIWQLAANDGNSFALRHKYGNVWRTAAAWFSEDHLNEPVLSGPAGGIRFDSNVGSMNGDKWNDYAGDGQLHRTDGQAYLTADDHFRIRKNGAAENKRFDLRTDTGHGQAQNDWQDDQFDFAEFFEWSDGNPNGEDRIGHTVAVDGLTGKIKIATEGDAVIGVVSGTAAFTANCAAMGWHGKYIRDEWGRYRFDLVKDADGNQLYSDANNKHEKITMVENPDWDSTQEYYSREERKEWDKIGIIGQCYVRKTAVIPSSWIKLKEIDSTKDFYLIK